MAANGGGKRELAARVSARFGLTSIIELLPKRSQFLILNYHRIGDPSATPYDSGTFSASAEEFDQQIGYLRKRFHMATLDEVTSPLPRNKATAAGTSVLITLDDGYRDNYTLAFRILRSHGVQGAFFLPTAFVGTGQIPWWDAVAYILKHSQRRSVRLEYPEAAEFDLDRQPVLQVIQSVLNVCKRNEVETERVIAELERACECPRPAADAERCFLSWAEAREMQSAGMAFGSHTHTHEILAKLSPERQMEEATVSRDILERELLQPIRTLAYPVGQLSTFSASTREILKQAGYIAAFSFYGGTNVPGTMERFDIQRVGVSEPSLARLRLQTSLVAVTGSVWF